MSSKSIHSLAGLAVGLGLIFATNPDPFHSALLLVGSQLGASAPDWLEVPVWVKRVHWFRPSENHRYSLIPHRTLTHTLGLWVVMFGLGAQQLSAVDNPNLNMVAVGFFASVLTHLLLDIRTPMGIPLLPFGRRYRLQGVRLAPAHAIQPRSGW